MTESEFSLSLDYKSGYCEDNGWGYGKSDASGDSDCNGIAQGEGGSAGFGYRGSGCGMSCGFGSKNANGFSCGYSPGKGHSTCYGEGEGTDDYQTE